jgi:hypothetical protein
MSSIIRSRRFKKAGLSVAVDPQRQILSTEVIDFFAPVREDFLSGGVPSYMTQR